MSDERLYTWEKQPRDTNASHAALISYRDCPKPRSLRKAAAWHYAGDANGLPSDGQFRQFREWSRLNDWVPRVEEYDAWLDYKKRISAVETAEKMGERHAQQAVAGLEVLFAPAKVFMQKFGRMPLQETALWELDDVSLIALMKATAGAGTGLMKAERLARGEPTEILQGSVEHDHRHLHAALATAEGRDAVATLGRLAIMGSTDLEGDGGGDPGEFGGLPPAQ